MNCLRIIYLSWLLLPYQALLLFWNQQLFLGQNHSQIWLHAPILILLGLYSRVTRMTEAYYFVANVEKGVSYFAASPSISAA